MGLAVFPGSGSFDQASGEKTPQSFIHVFATDFTHLSYHPNKGLWNTALGRGEPGFRILTKGHPSFSSSPPGRKSPGRRFFYGHLPTKHVIPITSLFNVLSFPFIPWSHKGRFFLSHSLWCPGFRLVFSREFKE